MSDRASIRPGRFVAALLAAPVWVLLLTLPAALFGQIVGFPGLVLLSVVAAFAVGFGYAAHLTFGAAAFAVALRLGATSPLIFALVGLAAHVVSLPVFFLLDGGLVADPQIAQTPLADLRTQSYPMGGAISAPMWGAVFGALYHDRSGRPEEAEPPRS